MGYLVDLTAFERGLQALQLEWEPSPGGFAGRVRVEGSDDLGSWRQLVPASPLIDLEVGGQRLQQKRVELPRQKVKYLRLSWLPQGEGTPLPELTGARAELVARSVEAQREWASVASTKGEKAGEYLFDTSGQFPVDRVRVHLPEANTVVQLELLVRDRSDQPWRRITTGVAYRLRKGDGEIDSPALVAGSAGEGSAPARPAWRWDGFLTSSCSQRAARRRSSWRMGNGMRSRRPTRLKHWCPGFAKTQARRYGRRRLRIRKW